MGSPLDPPSGPATSLIHGSCSSANHKLPFKSVSSMDKICSRWIHGPIVIDLGASNLLTNRLTVQILTCVASTSAIRSQPSPLDQDVVEWRAGRPPSAARCPKAPNRPPAAYKYPHDSLHYKRGCGARWRSAPIHFQALQASLIVLAEH